MKKLLLIIIVFAISTFCLFGLFACEKASAITINFIVDGEIYYSTNVKDGNIEMPANPTKDGGYLFVGWYLDESFENKFYSSKVQMISYDTNVYAKFDCTHINKSDWIIDSEDTCTTKGRKHKLCLTCGATVNNMTYDDIHHIYSEWEIISNPTCSQVGEKQRVCSICGNIEKQTIQKVAHTYGEWATTKEPTCSEVGTKQRTCEVCGNIETESIDMIEHSFDDGVVEWEATCMTNGATRYTCTECGEWMLVPNLPAIGYHIPGDDYICTVCGEKCSADVQNTTLLPKNINLPMLVKQKMYSYTYQIRLDNITYQVERYYSTTYRLNIYLYGEKIADTKGSSNSDTVFFRWKLYDYKGVVIDSGTIITNSLTIGDKFEDDCYSTKIEPGKTYWLEILDY